MLLLLLLYDTTRHTAHTHNIAMANEEVEKKKRDMNGPQNDDVIRYGMCTQISMYSLCIYMFTVYTYRLKPFSFNILPYSWIKSVAVASVFVPACMPIAGPPTVRPIFSMPISKWPFVLYSIYSLSTGFLFSGRRRKCDGRPMVYTQTVSTTCHCYMAPSSTLSS